MAAFNGQKYSTKTITTVKLESRRWDILFYTLQYSNFPPEFSKNRKSNGFPRNRRSKPRESRERLRKFSCRSIIRIFTLPWNSFTCAWSMDPGRKRKPLPDEKSREGEPEDSEKTQHAWSRNFRKRWNFGEGRWNSRDGKRKKNETIRYEGK